MLFPVYFHSKSWVERFLFVLRSHSILNCASPSNSGSTVGGLLFDGQLNDSLLDSLMDPSSFTSLCSPMQVQQNHESWIKLYNDKCYVGI